jgi:hypothetical protein
MKMHVTQKIHTLNTGGGNPWIAHRKAGIRDRIKHIVIPGIDQLGVIDKLSIISCLLSKICLWYACLQFKWCFFYCWWLWYIFVLEWFSLRLACAVYMFLGWLFHIWLIIKLLINNSRTRNTTTCTNIKFRLLL